MGNKFSGEGNLGTDPELNRQDNQDDDNCIFWPIPITDSGTFRSPILVLFDH